MGQAFFPFLFLVVFLLAYISCKGGIHCDITYVLTIYLHLLSFTLSIYPPTSHWYKGRHFLKVIHASDGGA
jgi:hypothetical protein